MDPHFWYGIGGRVEWVWPFKGRGRLQWAGSGRSLSACATGIFLRGVSDFFMLVDDGSSAEERC